MSDHDIAIPAGHWTPDGPGFSDWSSYVPHWEKQLRKNIANFPDPAKRFAAWLDGKASGLSNFGGIKLVFIEEPYLGWAKLIEQLEARTERDVRERIAYQVTHPDEQ